MLNQATEKAISDKNGRVFVQKEDATKLSFASGSFDRVIATQVLEHIPDPHKVLRWARVIKPGGALSLVLPCDPGFVWRFVKMLEPRKTCQKAGIDYDYWMAREHINSINNLVTFEITSQLFESNGCHVECLRWLLTFSTSFMLEFSRLSCPLLFLNSCCPITSICVC